MNLDEAIGLIRKRWPGVESNAQDEPVFLLAAGWRSGSTMLQRMLLRECFIWGEPFGSSGLLERMSQPLRRLDANWPKNEFFVTSPHWGTRMSEQWTANLYPPMQCLLKAHVDFFRALLAEPSRERGFLRWGLKEVRYGIEHAIYLQWLFPRAKFLFLVRNPYECWISYRRIGARVMRFWPEPSIMTPEQFGTHWSNLAAGFRNRWQEVNGMMIRYELLSEAEFDVGSLENFLGFRLDQSARGARVGVSPERAINAAELDRLKEVVGPVAEQFGYAEPPNSARM